jgi:hypothetical protein
MAIKWRNFLDQWKFFTDEENSLSETFFKNIEASSSFNVSLRAYIVRHFGQAVFTANSPRKNTWFNSYIVDGDKVLQKGRTMDAAIQRLKSSPPMTIYQLFEADIKSVGGKENKEGEVNKIDFKKFRSSGLDFIANKLSNNHFINPSILVIRKLESKLERLRLRIKKSEIQAKSPRIDFKLAADLKTSVVDPVVTLKLMLHTEIALKNELKKAQEASQIVTEKIRLYLINDAVNNELKKNAESAVNGNDVKSDVESGIDANDAQMIKHLQTAVSVIKNELPHDLLEHFKSDIKRASEPVNSRTFNSVYLDYLVDRLCDDSGVPEDPRASLNPEWKALQSLRAFMYRANDNEVPEIITSTLNKAETASATYTDAIRDYLIKRVRSEINNEAPLPYIFPKTQYALYVQQCEGVVKPLPPPTTVAVVGLRILNPLYWLDAIVGGLANGVARVMCGIVNKIGGDDKNGVIASIVKGVFAGPFILIKMATSGLATAFSVSSWSEPERARIVPIVVAAARYQVTTEVKPPAPLEMGHRRQSSTYISTFTPPQPAQQLDQASGKVFSPPPLVHAKTGLRLSPPRESVSTINATLQRRGSVVSSKKDDIGLFKDAKQHRRKVTRSSYPPAAADDTFLPKPKK